MKAKIWTVLIAAAFMILGSVAIASATPGTSAGSGSVSVQNVYVWDKTLTGPTSKTIDVDCPAGTEVLTGYGTAYESVTQDLYGQVSGSALDSDTWRVTFSISSSVRYIYQVSATCN